MLIRFQCQICAKNLKASEELAGQRIRCPGCRTVMVAPVIKGPYQLVPKDRSRRNEIIAEIEPKTHLTATFFFLAAGCFGFTVVGLCLMATPAFLVGCFSVLFFGGVFALVCIRLFRRHPVTMVLSTEALQYGWANIPWIDIEAIGVIRLWGVKHVGLRLCSYNRLLGDMSPKTATEVEKGLRYTRWGAKVASLIPKPMTIRLLQKLWATFENRGDEGEFLEKAGKVGSVAQLLVLLREHFGYELILSWADIDRPANDFADFLEEHRANAV